MGVVTAEEISSPAMPERTAIRLLKALDDRGMPDVALWVLDRVDADKDSGAKVKQEVGFRRAAALVASTKTESDPVRQIGRAHV